MQVNQDRLISMAAGFQYSKILMTANELGIFREIGGKSRTARELSTRLKLDPEATGILLGALVGLGLLTHKAGRFINPPDVKKYLSDEGEDGMACITRHMNHLYENWANLDEIVRKGRPKKRGPSKILTDRKQNRDFICGMFEIGMGTARMLADTIDFTGVQKMADIGGGPAQYPIAFSAKNPDTKFVVADHKNTLKVAREYVRKYGLTKRIKLMECNFFDVPELGIGDDYDMALMSQVLHAEDEGKCASLIKKTYRILRPGGRLIINENALNEDRMSPPSPLIFAVNMLVVTSGRTYTQGEMSAWLKAAGFKDIKARRLHERSLIIEARK
jgi:ubiquinone/menaquinone biosynthesis C-methylase UbiE